MHPGQQLSRVDPLEKLRVEQRHLLRNLVVVMVLVVMVVVVVMVMVVVGVIVVVISPA